MASINDGGSSDFPDILGNDELSANLIKCATLVKRGEKQHPLLHKTIQDLTYFVTGYHARHGSLTNGINNSVVVTSNSSGDSPQSTTLSKKQISVTNLTNGMLSNLGLRSAGDDQSSQAGTSVRTEAEKSATSMKNAERAKTDVQRALGSGDAGKSGSKAKRPPFQRPTNPNSSLIANGWIEQQRRSKLRVVWKEVLASLVEGRKPGEDTTLWIQREYYHHASGKMELEALHQIPIKFLKEVTYQSYTTDHRFLIKVKNMHEDFIFRCEKSEEAAESWVTTIRSLVETSRHGKPVKTALDNWDHHSQQQQQQQQQLSNESSVSFEDEKKAPDAPLPPRTATPSIPPPPSAHPPVVPPAAHPPSGPPTATIQQMSVTEMRAIAHGAGIQTHGMERGELEHIVYQIHAASTGVRNASPIPTSRTASPSYAPSPTPPDAAVPRASAVDEEKARRAHLDEVERQQQIEEAARRRKLNEDAARSRAAAEAQQNYLRQQQEATERQKRAEEERKRLEIERLRKEEEEHQRRVAEQQAAEQRRRLEEQQRQQQAQWQQQQQNWQKQQAEDEQRRIAEEQRMAEEKRRQEEAFRAQQQWQQKQQQSNNPGAQHWQPPPPRPYGAAAPQYAPSVPPHPGMGHAPPPPPPQAGNSPVNLKYAKMASQSVDGGLQSLQVIKHGILVEWALQPPAMQILRPIETLITSVHSVFPPKYGVPGHEHFKKWSVVTLPEVLSGAQPDFEKLSKVVRKLRFILHPDKLPREFNEGQTYMCKMLWDIVSDAFEDHKKKEEELGWMR